VAGILLAMLSLAVGGLIWTGQRTNELAIERQRTQLLGAVEARKRQALSDLARVVTAPEMDEALRWPMDPAAAQRQFGTPLAEYFEFEASFVVTPEDFVVTGRIEDGPADQRAFAMRRPLLAGVLADVLRRADARAGELAGIADDRRVRGLACEASYDAARAASMK